MANASPDTFNGDVTLSVTGPGLLYMAHNVAGTVFNGNILVNSTSTSQGIYFSDNGSGSSTLAAGRTISAGVLGFTTGQLRLQRFTQTGNTAQNLTLTSTAQLRLGPASQFDGNVNFVAPQMLLQGSAFNGTAYLEKTGTADNTGTGGDVFASTTTLVNSGSGSFEFGSTLPETFNGNLTVTNTGLARVQIGLSSLNNTFNGSVTINHGGNSASINTIIARNANSSAIFNGNLFLNCTNINTASGIVIGNDGNISINGNITVSSTSGRGILFGAAGGLVTLADGFGINAPAGTFTTGTLTLKQFTQVGPTPQALTLTGNADLTLGSGSTFNGTVNFVTPQIFLNGTTFNSTTILEKTGAVSNSGAGSNIFNGVTTITNSGSGNFISAATSQDIFNNDLTLFNIGTALISMADASAGNLFNGNIVANSTLGGGIYFGNNPAASAALATGKTITIGGSGFTSGELRMRRFTQLGATPQTLTLTGTAIIRVGPVSTFNGNVIFKAPRVFLDGTTFNGTADIEKTGASDDAGDGGNTFNLAATLTDSGPGYFMTGNTTPDIFNGDLTLTNTNVASLRLANNSVGNQFNGNLIVSSTNGTGILIGNTGGSSTLASGRTINVGAFGYTAGELRIRRLTQLGTTAQAVTLTGTGIFRIGPATVFNANVTFISPHVFLEGGTFNGVSLLQKTGSGTSDNAGGNIFNGTTTIQNSGGGRWRLSETAADTYPGSVTFIKSSTGALEAAYNFVNQFSSDITTNLNSSVTFGSGSGVIELTGSNPQIIAKAVSTTSPIMSRITLNKASGDVTLNTDVSTNAAVFTSGILNTTTASYLNFRDDGTATGMSNTSYVDGPVRKTGNDAFTFPVGDNGFYRPISISAPGTATTTYFFIGQYFNTPQAFGGPSTWDPTFWTVSACEYWTLDRNTGTTANVNVTLSWNDAVCGGPGYITNPADLRVTRWNGTAWVNHGNGGVTGNSSSGTIATSGVVTAFSPFTLASLTRLNPLPVELKKFWAIDGEATVTLKWITASELNNENFTIQRSQNGIDFEDIGTLQGAGTKTEETFYTFIDESPKGGLSYYRLKQKDFNGEINYPNGGILSLTRKGEGLVFNVYPNPAGDEVVTLSQKSNIVILNSLDQIVGTAQEVDKIDVSSLPSGVYIIRNQNGQVARLIKK
jgi:hypothetical protein